jgi:hypothetical protein
MGFNYLQTDDRDDYFAQFDSHRERHKPTSYTLINSLGENVLDSQPNFRLRDFAKKLTGKRMKGVWRETLTTMGYTVINNY